MTLFFKHKYLISMQAFRWFALNCFFSNFSNGLTYILLSWVILNKHNSINALAVLMICFWSPTVILGPIIGAITDHFSRKWLMIISNSSRSVLLVALLLLALRNFTLLDIYIAAILLSILGNLYGPAEFVYIREIVPKQHLLHANSITKLSYELGNIAGMASAGVLLALFSIPAILGISSALFIFAALCLFLIRTPTLEVTQSKIPHSSLVVVLKEGVRYLIEHRNLRLIYTAQLLLMINFLTAPIFLAPFAKNVLHTTVGEFGVMQAALSVGVMLGSLVVPKLVDMWKLSNILYAKVSSVAILFFLFSLSMHIIMSDIIYLLIGFNLAAWTLLMTLAQTLTELSYQARVQATFNSFAAIIILTIYLLLNFSGAMIPFRLLFIFEALVALTAVFLLWRARHVL